MLAFRRSDGTLLWETPVPSSGVEHTYPKNSHASATPATDGQRVYASFGTHGLAAFDFAGKLAVAPEARRPQQLPRQRRIAGALQGSALHLPGPRRTATLRSFVAAFDTRNGQTSSGRHDRAESVGWGTPIVIDAGDHDELDRQQPADACTRYDPSTGRRAVDRARQHVRGDSDAGRRPRPRVLLVGPRRSDARDPAGRQRRRHRHARRVDRRRADRRSCRRRSSTAICST